MRTQKHRLKSCRTHRYMAPSVVEREKRGKNTMFATTEAHWLQTHCENRIARNLSTFELRVPARA